MSKAKQKPNEWTVSVRKVGQAQYKFRISALPRFQYYVFSFFKLAKKISPRGFPPRPFLRADRIQNPRRISKTFVSVLRNPFPENSFRKTESIFSERLISQYLSRSAFPRTFHSWKALCFAQRRA